MLASYHVIYRKGSQPLFPKLCTVANILGKSDRCVSNGEVLQPTEFSHSSVTVTVRVLP